MSMCTEWMYIGSVRIVDISHIKCCRYASVQQSILEYIYLNIQWWWFVKNKIWLIANVMCIWWSKLNYWLETLALLVHLFKMFMTHHLIIISLCHHFIISKQSTKINEITITTILLIQYHRRHGNIIQSLFSDLIDRLYLHRVGWSLVNSLHLYVST